MPLFAIRGGVWDRLDPSKVGTAEGLIAELGRQAETLVPFFLELLDSFDQADPNPGHYALAELERRGLVHTIITQNIDNLHQEAGSRHVIEVHGNGFRLCCLTCGSRQDRLRHDLIADIRQKVTGLSDYSWPSLLGVMPLCPDCQSIMRPDVVMFGESVQGLPEAFQAARNCEVLLAVGTSGVVYPAAYLPYEAKRQGAAVIVVNPTENAFADVSDVYLPLRAGQALPEMVGML